MKRFVIIFSALLLLGSCSKPVDELKIISFNIRYNSYENIDGENGWPNRKEAVVRMIREERPAAIGLQEALIDQLQYLDSCLPNYRRIGVGRDDGEEGGEFMAIYYDTTRLELVGQNIWWLSETPHEPSRGWDAACNRMVTEAVLRDRKSGKEFFYLNTHLDHVGQVARAEGAKYIASILDNTDSPAILGGDMNTEGDLNTLKNKNNEVKNSTIDDTIFNAFYNVGLKPARELTDNTSHKDTYTGFGKDKPSLIDHFFVKDLKVVSFRTLDGDYGVPYISDHYPIELVIKL